MTVIKEGRAEGARFQIGDFVDTGYFGVGQVAAVVLNEAMGTQYFVRTPDRPSVLPGPTDSDGLYPERQLKAT